MARIDLDLNNLLKPIKEAQEQMSKLLSQMQEASKIGSGMSSGIKTQGVTPGNLSSYLKNLQQARMDAAASNVIQFPGAPLSNLASNQQVSSSTLAPQNPIAQAARANVSSNINPLSVAEAYNANLSINRSTGQRQEIINKLGKSEDPGVKFLGESLKTAVEDAQNAFKEFRELSKQMLDSNGKIIKDNTEVQKQVAEKLAQANKLQDQANSLQSELNKFAKNNGGGGGGDGPGSLFNRIGGWRGAALIAGAIGGAGLSVGGAYARAYQQDVFANLQAGSAIANANNITFQQQMGAAAPMSGRDILRNYGNLVAPDVIGNGGMIGTGGFRRALAAGSNMQAQEVSSSFFNGLLGIGGSAFRQGLTGAVIGGEAGSIIPGIGTIGAAAAGGILGLGSGLASGISNFADSKYIQQRGGMASFLPGFGNEAQRQRNLFGARYIEQQAQLAQQIQDQALSNPEAQRRAQGLDVRMATQQAQLAGTSLVGARSFNAFDYMTGTSAASFNNMVDRQAQAIAKEGVPFVLRDRDPQSIARGMFAGNVGALAARAGKMAGDLMLDSTELTGMGNMWQAFGGKGSEVGSLARLRFAGLGSAEQLGGQMFGLQSSTNRPLSIEDFKKALAEGVSAGFTSAPMMQAFMGTLTQLSQALGVADVNKASNTLNLMSAAMSTSGVGGLRSLREGAAAMASLGNYTGQGSGVVGMMKTMAGVGMGMGGAQGGNIANTMNSAQLNEARDALAQIAGAADPQAKLNQMEKAGTIKKDTARLARLNMGNIGGAAQALGAMADASQSQLRSIVNLTLGRGGIQAETSSIADMLRSGRSMKEIVKSDAFKDIDARITNAMQASGVDRNAGTLMVYEDALRSLSPEERKDFERRGGIARFKELADRETSGAGVARSNKFLQAQKSLTARLGAEANISAGGFLSDQSESVQGAAKDLGMSVSELKKAMGIAESGRIKSEDLTGFLMNRTGQGGTQTMITGFTTTALNQFAAAVKLGTTPNKQSEKLFNEILPGPK